MTMTQLLASVYARTAPAEPEAASSSSNSSSSKNKGGDEPPAGKDEADPSAPPGSSSSSAGGGAWGRAEGSSVKELQFNDLRYLMNQFHTHEDPMILVRKHAVLISVNPLR